MWRKGLENGITADVLAKVLYSNFLSRPKVPGLPFKVLNNVRDFSRQRKLMDSLTKRCHLWRSLCMYRVFLYICFHYVSPVWWQNEGKLSRENHYSSFLLIFCDYILSASWRPEKLAFLLLLWTLRCKELRLF